MMHKTRIDSSRLFGILLNVLVLDHLWFCLFVCYVLLYFLYSLLSTTVKVQMTLECLIHNIFIDFINFLFLSMFSSSSHR